MDILEEDEDPFAYESVSSISCTDIIISSSNNNNTCDRSMDVTGDNAASFALEPVPPSTDICQNITVGTVDELEGNKNVLDVQIHYFEEESTLNSDIVPDSDSESDEFDYQPDSSNSDKTFFQDYHNIFFRKTEKNPIGKNGQLKKMDRVFNTRHACLFCGKLFAKVHDHIMQKHHDEAEVQLLPSINNPDKEKRRRMLTLLRNKGDHKHNKRVMEAKQGELILARRPAGVKSIRTDQFKPCPSCFMWVSDVAKHRSHSNRCVEKKRKNIQETVNGSM